MLSRSLALVQNIMPNRYRVTGDSRQAGQFFITLLRIEILIHVSHISAIQDAHAWSGMTSAQLPVLAFATSSSSGSRSVLDNHVTSNRRLWLRHAALTTQALLPQVGTRRQAGPAREYDPLHGKYIPPPDPWRTWHRLYFISVNTCAVTLPNFPRSSSNWLQPS
jgi:hypothetical protein